MEITATRNDDQLILALTGRLDSVSAPDFELALHDSLDGVATLILDFAALDYVSSAGLRVILGAQKRMLRQGSMRVRNVNAQIMEIFEMTGFTGMLTID